VQVHQFSRQVGLRNFHSDGFWAAI